MRSPTTRLDKLAFTVDAERAKPGLDDAGLAGAAVAKGSSPNTTPTSSVPLCDALLRSENRGMAQNDKTGQ